MKRSSRRAFLGGLSRVGGWVMLGGPLAALPAEWAGAASATGVTDPPAPVARPVGVGATRRLEILPLVDWATAAPDLRGEAGASYLVRTDGSTILFDVGGNLAGSDPSPLEHNMRRLGVGLADVDTIVISHPHMDHVGGLHFARAGTFSLGLRQVALDGKRVVVPAPMSYPGATPQVARVPTVLAPGVVTTGPITGALPIGPVDEQALAVRVQGKGVVLIVGCGHQGLPKLLERAQQLFDEPLHGIVGGLHYPVPRGRMIDAGGMDVQRWATYGFGPGPSLADVQREIDLLAARRLQWVSLSPHDSSDEVIELFRRAFGEQYHDLRVGEAQRIGLAE
jgi:metal-dependent hydrolase (beta-lactamase superfamily II)